jgi:hypothetical protein
MPFILTRNDVIEKLCKGDEDNTKRWEVVKGKLKEYKLNVILGRNVVPVEGGQAQVVTLSLTDSINGTAIIQTYAPSEYLMLQKLEEFFKGHSIELY